MINIIKSIEMKSNAYTNKIFRYGLADFLDNKIIVLSEPSDEADIIEDKTVINPLNFDQLIESNNKKYISYITLSGIRRYSLIETDTNIKASLTTLDADTYKWSIFKIYKKHYIDTYTKPEETNNKKSLSTCINTLYTNLQPEGLGLCAQFVHWALNVAGFKFQGKYSAKLYHLEGLLKDLGFEEIDKNTELKKGDIIVIVDEKLKKDPLYYGHICLWDGNYWLCDYKDKTLKNKDKSHLYRYNLWEE